MKKRDPIAEYCQEWVRWCDTRAFYVRPATNGVLGRLQPSKVGTEPNARNSPDMPYFNMAVYTLADMAKWKAKFAAFYAHYLGTPEVAKRAADQLGIGRRTYYDHIKSFSAAAYRLSGSIKKAHENLGLTGPSLTADVGAAARAT